LEVDCEDFATRVSKLDSRIATSVDSRIDSHHISFIIRVISFDSRIYIDFRSILLDSHISFSRLSDPYWWILIILFLGSWIDLGGQAGGGQDEESFFRPVGAMVLDRGPQG
jgi:hypothetical protein